jgi:hypothetical protein
VIPKLEWFETVLHFAVLPLCSASIIIGIIVLIALGITYFLLTEEAGPLDLKVVNFRPIIIIKNLSAQVPSSDSTRLKKNMGFTRIIFFLSGFTVV